ncbi:MarR family winged helix-turn-helix transcriptional regulator [Mucilaginibacter sp. KACC 22063]|uniref:MarR family winged helix-turn-helix transcriptional regulator n=1 Tax=Mucilaginibacter sp. KACC 22063 TaxID=3025666 RepID=UPI0023669508|nr:MarR family transcriptional regulator [Mucilaginibacter sp. KACC 22063]WDF55000.1 MarR family transcriptional regulator [Mucilaginibacter sp. KACC 22063]
MEITIPISRKLFQLGRIYVTALAKQVAHLDISRYMDILVIIHLHNGWLTQKGLSRLLNKDKSALVSIIDQLTQKGYVYRETNPADRREHLLKTTDKAAEEVPQILEAFKQMNQNSTENISTDDLETFNRVLLQIEQNLKNQISAEPSTYTQISDTNNL